MLTYNNRRYYKKKKASGNCNVFFQITNIPLSENLINYYISFCLFYWFVPVTVIALLAPWAVFQPCPIQILVYFCTLLELCHHATIIYYLGTEWKAWALKIYWNKNKALLPQHTLNSPMPQAICVLLYICLGQESNPASVTLKADNLIINPLGRRFIVVFF